MISLFLKQALFMEQFNSFAQKHNDHIVLTKRQASMIMASMILCGLFVFIVGFFLGKRTVIEDFSLNITQNTLHDQIDFLLTSTSLQSINTSDSDTGFDEIPVLEDVDKKGSLIDDADVSFEIIVDSKKEDDVVSKAPIKNTNKAQELIEIDIVNSDTIGTKIDNQYACLIGFGTKKAAQTFVTRLQKNNINLLIKTMISKTAAGKQKTWYQVVTPTCQSHNELHDIVHKVKRLERIRDSDIKYVHVK